MKRFELTEAFSQSLDAVDPLRGFRGQFLMPENPGKQRMYFLGNSLGHQPKPTPRVIIARLHHWAADDADSCFAGAPPCVHLHRSSLQTISVISGPAPP